MVASEGGPSVAALRRQQSASAIAQLIEKYDS